MKYNNLLDKTISLWLPVVLWALLIFSFSAHPTSSTSQVQLADFAIKKTAHIVEYAVFATLFYRALYSSGISKKEAAIYSVILAILYGASDEFHQSFTPGREPRVRDVFFDTTGAFIAIYFIINLLPKAPKRIRVFAKSLQIL